MRLLTTKPDPKSKDPPKSRGIAFLEVASSEAMQACLKLHHSSIQNRRINVELTAGGGGKSDARQGKIKERNERVGGQRERRAEKEKEAEAEAARANGGVIPVVETERRPRNNRDRGENKEEKREVEVVREDGPMTSADGSTVKVRGGRRSKVKPVSFFPLFRRSEFCPGQDMWADKLDRCATTPRTWCRWISFRSTARRIPRSLNRTTGSWGLPRWCWWSRGFWPTQV